MNRQEAALLKTRLSPFLSKDPHSLGGAYFIRSVYFDNKSNESFREKVEGFENRRKFRIRFYDFTLNFIKFEIKQKLNDLIVKHTARILKEDLPALFRGDYDCLLKYRSAVLNQIFYDFKCQLYEPVVVVDYYREAFFLDYNHIRITFDTRLKKTDAVNEFYREDLSLVPVLEDHYVILEVKYDDFLPNWFGDLCQASRYQRVATSKYCLSRMI